MTVISTKRAKALCGSIIESIDNSKGLSTIYKCNDKDIIVTTKKDCFNNPFNLDTISGLLNNQRGMIVPILIQN